MARLSSGLSFQAFVDRFAGYSATDREWRALYEWYQLNTSPGLPHDLEINLSEGGAGFTGTGVTEGQVIAQLSWLRGGDLGAQPREARLTSFEQSIGTARTRLNEAQSTPTEGEAGASPSTGAGASPTRESGAGASPAATTPAPGDMSSELAAALAEQGIDLEAIPGAGGATASLFERGDLDPNAPIWGAPGEIVQPRTGWKGGTVFPAGPTPSPGTTFPSAPLRSEPAKWWLEQFYKMDPRERADLQRRMYEGGFYGSSVTEDEIQFGFPDQASYSAWIDVLTTAARYNEAGTNYSPDDVIAQGAANAAAGGTGSREPFLTTAPEDVRTGLQARARERLGRELSDDEVAMFTDYFHEREVAAGTAAGTAEGLTAVAAPPSVAGAAQDWIRRERRAEEIAYSAAQRQFEFFDMLESPVRRG